MSSCQIHIIKTSHFQMSAALKLNYVTVSLKRLKPLFSMIYVFGQMGG